MEEVNVIQKLDRVVNKLLDAHNNARWLSNETQCVDLFRWQHIGEGKSFKFPWIEPRKEPTPQDHSVMLLQ